MKKHWVEYLTAPGGGPGFDLDAFREADDEIVEAFLVTKDTREPYPIIAGLCVLPASLPEHLRAYGNVYRRIPLRDPRMVRFIVGRAGSGFDVVPFDHVVSHYQDLADDPPEGYDVTPAPDDAAIVSVLTTLRSGTSEDSTAFEDSVAPEDSTAFEDSAALEVGCGVGRACFALRAHASRVLGLDASLARVRRARNISVTVENFFLPGPRVDGKPTKEIKLNLDSLLRDGVDFVAGNAAALPLCDDAVDVVVVRAKDGEGIWENPAGVWSEAQRVLRPNGVLIWETSLPVDAPKPAAQVGDFCGVRIASKSRA